MEEKWAEPKKSCRTKAFCESRGVGLEKPPTESFLSLETQGNEQTPNNFKKKKNDIKICHIQTFENWRLKKCLENEKE